MKARKQWREWISPVFGLGFVLGPRRTDQFRDRVERVLVVLEGTIPRDELAADARQTGEVKQLRSAVRAWLLAETPLAPVTVQLVEIRYNIEWYKQSPYDDVELMAVPEPKVVRLLSIDQFLDDSLVL